MPVQHPRRPHSRAQRPSCGRGDFQGLRGGVTRGEADRRGRRAEHERSDLAFGVRWLASALEGPTMQVTLIDSPVANVANIARALREVGADLRVTRDADAIANAEKIVLPGVGSFAAAMQWLREFRIDEAIRTATSKSASLLGVCVGHQLLFDVSHEMGTTPGLGLLRGEVRQFDGPLP